MAEQFPTFDEFYAATHRGREPLPWQRRLAERVADDSWPAEIGVPTGLGKTACLDIAVWALAAQAAVPPAERTAPTRTWYVVNRRLLVDAAYDHGLNLQRWLKESDFFRQDWPDAPAEAEAAVKAVGQALGGLAGLGTEQGPLHITRLRGGADLGARAPDPAQPAIVFATVPMFASRWLFRGFGSSRLMRSVDAALAGADSLILMDEAHLARPLARLADPVAGPVVECDAGDPASAGLLPTERARPRFVALTATGHARDDRFDLNDEDLAHPIVRERAHAAKRAILRETREKSLVADLATAALEALALAAEPTSCLVFANTPEAARAVHDQVGTLAAKQGVVLDSWLLTGRMREREAAAVRHALQDPAAGAPSDRRRGVPRSRHLVVVATQTLEVGADLDVDHLVTETAGVRSIVQRLGRLNRLGRSSDATATILHPGDRKEWPVYGTEPAEVWERLQAAGDAAAAAGRDLVLSPSAVADVLGEAEDVPDRVAELLPHHLDVWAKTSRRPDPYETPPELFYDTREQTYSVTVLWRAWLPGLPAPDADDERVGEVTSTNGAEGTVVGELMPPVARDEAVDLPVEVLKGGLRARGIDHVHRVLYDGRTLERTAVDDLGPGHIVVLAAAAGFYDEHGWNPAATQPVVDLSPLRIGLILDRKVIDALFDIPEAAAADTDDAVAGDGNGPGRVGDAGVRGPGADDDMAVLDAALKRLREQPADDADEEVVRNRRDVDLRTVADILRRAERSAGLTAEEGKDWSDWRDGWHHSITENGPDCLVWLPDGTPMVEVPRRRRHRQRAEVRSDAFDDLSFVDVASEPGLEVRSSSGLQVDPASPLLKDHLQTVGAAAEAIAIRLGLPDDVVQAVREAGATHDLGKHEARFQRWLNPAPADAADVLAKSATPPTRREITRRQAHWPRGGRHELLSARLLAKGLPPDMPLRDLVIHLVISHHGHGRPDVDVVDDDMPTKLRAPVSGVIVDVDGDLSRPDWEQPARFRRQCETYGYWGLALLEAIVRQADHAASARSEVA